MFKKEAAWIAQRLALMDAADIGTILNVGSSSEPFRTKTQPWIDEELFANAFCSMDIMTSPGTRNAL